MILKPLSVGFGGATIPIKRRYTRLVGRKCATQKKWEVWDFKISESSMMLSLQNRFGVCCMTNPLCLIGFLRQSFSLNVPLWKQTHELGGPMLDRVFLRHEMLSKMEQYGKLETEKKKKKKKNLESEMAA